ncbi:flavin-nucleotide-binding protein [Ophiostoma piceae UAMH 11346]|uniref:Flavin-nucleotide-binding protein n=1 Tax=Ophiostoma piceae (strain UAMH 11346) TaxID=1262450 RepID=S3CUU3_OPHP1|nr:flavin-nucleotide-binding protein [Ophiostoma piceae UAMH 11346]
MLEEVSIVELTSRHRRAASPNRTMPRHELTYPKDAHNTVKRYNSNAIHSIVNESPLVHVSFLPEGSPFPAVLPMIGQMGSFDRPSADIGDVLDLYLHGYVSSRLVNLSRNSGDPAKGEKEGDEEGEKAGEEGEKAGEKAGEKKKEPGLPVTVCASLVDGLVLALSPNAHSYNYRSAVLFGYATVVTDVAEKLYAMEIITNGVVPDRWSKTRVPPNAAEMQSTSVLRVRIVNGSAKIRTGSTHDDRCDLDDDSVLDSVWAGVIPLYPALGTPIPATYNRVKAVPDYLEQYRADFNTSGHEASIEAAAEPPANAKE